MEAMDICLATAKDVSYLVINHPVYSAVGSFVILLSLMRFYCRLTLGICECDEDMTGKTVVVTGASAGIGKSTALDMAKRNARVLLACRNIGKANKVADKIKSSTGNQNVIVKCLDLSSFESVRRCAQNIIDSEEKIDVLINNAGISGTESYDTEDGYKSIMQTNHLGHFLFTLLLLDLIKKSAPSRIINVASAAYNIAKPGDILDFKNEKQHSPLTQYSNSKLANIYFTMELAQRLSDTGVTVNSLHPGCVKTDILNDAKTLFAFFTKLLFFVVGKSSDEGAQTSIYLAVHPGLSKTTGKYFSDCKEEALKDKQIDRALVRRLFEASEKAVGISFTKT